MTAEPQIEVDPAREARGVESDFIARLAERVGAHLPEDSRALVEAGRADWLARIERGEAPPNDASTAEDWAALRARLAAERATDWRASVDPEYADAHPSKLSEDQHPDKLRAWWSSGGRILYLRSATVGNGKTYAAHAIANAVCDRVWVAGWTVADFLASQRQGEYDARAWKIATRCDLLILDDLGQEMGIGWEKEKARETIHRLLDTRARRGKRTIITTNRSGEWIESKEGYGSALADRFVHDALPLVFEGPSRRAVRDWGDL